MIRKTGCLIFIICLFTLNGFSQGKHGNLGIKPTKTGVVKIKRIKPVATKPPKPTVIKPQPPKPPPVITPVVSKPKPIPVKSSKILWTDNCDPRTDPERCKISTKEAVTAGFYNVIKSVNGKITYKIPGSRKELESYKVVIVDFYADNITENLIDVIKEYIKSGGSVFILGGNVFQTGGRNTSWWASQVTKDFGVTFTSDDDSKTPWAETVGNHPTTLKIERMYFSQYAYLNVAGPSEPILTVSERPIAAVYDGTGAFVALADDVGFGWGPNSSEGFGPTDNIKFWQNSLGWLIRHSKIKKSMKTSATDSEKNTNSDFSAIRVRIVREDSNSKTTKNETNSVDLAKQYYDSGSAYLKSGKFDLAITDFTKTIAIDSKYKDTYLLLGYAYRSNEQYDLAINSFTKAIEYNPNSAWAYNYRAFTYRLVGEVDKSIADATKAIELNPNEAEMYHTRALAYSKKGETDPAISDYTKAIGLLPKFYLAYLNRGSSYADKHDYENAIADATKAIELYNKSSGGYDLLGRCYFAKEDYNGAIVYISKAIQIDPKEKVFYNNRATVYDAIGRKDLAAADRRKAKKLGGK